MHQKLAPEPFLILLNNPKHSQCTQEILLKVKYKRDLELVTSCSSGYIQNKFRKIPLFVMYYLTKFDDVMLSSSWVIPKITSENLYKSIHDIINYSTTTCPFESGKCGKERKKKNTKIWISREREGLFRWNKKHFS